jgi:hypothetical protein
MVDEEEKGGDQGLLYLKMNISGAWAWNAAKPAPSPFGI